MPYDGDWFFAILTEYLTRYASDPLSVRVSASKLARYRTTLEVLVPFYIGFHVLQRWSRRLSTTMAAMSPCSWATRNTTPRWRRQ